MKRYVEPKKRNCFREKQTGIWLLIGLLGIVGIFRLRLKDKN